jgi:hypothetical protein
LVALRQAAIRNDEPAIKAALSQLVQGYTPATNELDTLPVVSKTSREAEVSTV